MGFGTIGLIGTLAATGVSLYGQHQQQKSVEKAAKYNNRLAEIEATNIEAESRQAIVRQRETDRGNLATIRNQLAGSGDRATTGTPLLLLGEAAGRMELGIADAARNAAIAAASQRQKGRMGLWEAEVQGQASRTRMLGTAIGGLTSAFSQYQQGKDIGIYPRFKTGGP